MARVGKTLNIGEFFFWGGGEMWGDCATIMTTMTDNDDIYIYLADEIFLFFCGIFRYY